MSTGPEDADGSPGRTDVSVRGEAHETVGPDSAAVDVRIRATRDTKADALAEVGRVLDRVTAGLASLGGIPLTLTTTRAPLTWSVRSSSAHPEYEADAAGVRRVTAIVQVAVSVRDLGLLDEVTAAVSAEEAVESDGTSWSVDDDNPAWARVRTAAVRAAVDRARQHARALGGSLVSVDHVADTGLLGPEGVRTQDLGWRAQSAGAGTVSPDPVPQELTVVVEARFTASGMSPA